MNLLIQVQIQVFELCVEKNSQIVPRASKQQLFL